MTKTKDPLRVLVVEDLADVRNYLVRFLSRRGCDADGAAGAAEAVARCGRQRYELVLLDERLPDGSGIAAIKELKRRLPEAFIVLLTGGLTDAVAQEAAKAGADRCLSKPPDFATLEALVAERRKARVT